MIKFTAVLKQVLMRYPAIIAAYFIFGYYFLSTMEFYIEFKNKNIGGAEILQHFDTLLWMWVLSFVLVKVLDMRQRLDNQQLAFEVHKLEQEKELTQLRTLKEIAHTLHHELNNPLAVIYLHAQVLRRRCAAMPEVAPHVAEIESASKRIHGVVMDLSSKLSYSTVESPVGALISVSDGPVPVKKEHVPGAASSHIRE